MLVAIITINNAPTENINVMNVLVTVERVNMYLGTLTFFRRDAFFSMEFIASVLDSRIYENIMLPITK